MKCEKCVPSRFNLSPIGVEHSGDAYNHVGLGPSRVGFLFVTSCGLQYIMDDAPGLPHTERTGKKWSAERNRIAESRP